MAKTNPKEYEVVFKKLSKRSNDLKEEKQTSDQNYMLIINRLSVTSIIMNVVDPKNNTKCHHQMLLGSRLTCTDFAVSIIINPNAIFFSFMSLIEEILTL